jgi:hypothetical protein
MLSNKCGIALSLKTKAYKLIKKYVIVKNVDDHLSCWKNSTEQLIQCWAGINLQFVTKKKKKKESNVTKGKQKEPEYNKECLQVCFCVANNEST